MGSPTAPYRLQFVPQAKAEWDALDGSIRTQIDGAQKPKAPTHKTPSSSIHYPIDRVQKPCCPAMTTCNSSIHYPIDRVQKRQLADRLNA